jgi:hypothetical protein
MNKKERWVIKCNEIHGEKYDYSNTNYVDSKTLVEINCPQHGIFKKSPSNHAHPRRPQGCVGCLKDQAKEKFIYELIQLFNKTHNNKYDYSEMNYLGSKVPINIICPEHGSFSLRLDAHRNGKGCHKCVQKNNGARALEQYIETFKKIHAGKYDYSLFEYNGYNERIAIVCPDHGKFKLLIASHVRGIGCPRCDGRSGIERGDKSKFVELANIQHNSRYDYSPTVFTNLPSRIEILCPHHGMFTQQASEHLRGHGCKQCSYDAKRGAKFTNESYIDRFREVHGDKFDYSLVSINGGTKDRIQVICRVHGPFITRVDTHLAGFGCRTCSHVNTSLVSRLSQEKVIERMRKVHDNLFDYSKAVYTLSKEKLTVTCPRHGDFQVEAMKHLNGTGCLKCAIEGKTSNKDDFIREARLYHGDRYNYNDVDYKTAHISVRIKCKEHGVFSQSPNNHKKGQGCPYCGEFARQLENKEKDTPTLVYYLTLKHNDLIFYKIGITTMSIKSRFRRLNSDGVEIISAQKIKTTLINALEIEQRILFDFQDYGLLMRNVLVQTKGGTECFCDDVLGVHGMELSDYLEFDTSF